MSARPDSWSSNKTLKRERNESDMDLGPDLLQASAKQRKIDAVTTIAALNAAAEIQNYHRLLSEEGAAFLFSSRFSQELHSPTQRVTAKYQVTTDQAIEELRRLLAIKAFTADTVATKISPTPLMDELWHAVILDTQLYADLQAALGIMLHHRPSGAEERDFGQLEKRLITMKTIYAAFFSTVPLELAAPQFDPDQLTDNPAIMYTVKLLTGRHLECRGKPDTTIRQIRHALQCIGALPSDIYHVISYKGRKRTYDDTLGGLGGLQTSGSALVIAGRYLYHDSARAWWFGQRENEMVIPKDTCVKQ